MKKLTWAVLVAVLFFSCGATINQAVKMDRLNYRFHIRTWIDQAEFYDHTIMNIPWIEVEYFKALEYRRAEIFLDMIEDYEVENWEVIIE